MSSKDKKASKKVTKKKSADKEDTKSAKDLDSPCNFKNNIYRDTVIDRKSILSIGLKGYRRCVTCIKGTRISR